MKTLVIHPTDPTTDFLIKIYDGRGYDVIRHGASRRVLTDAIKSHDRIIMLGHGTEMGLICTEQMRYLIDSKYVYLLREKDCVCIWCNADMFVEKYGLKCSLYTGMIISDEEEANMFCVMTRSGDVQRSNNLFASSIAPWIEVCQLSRILESYHDVGNRGWILTEKTYTSMKRYRILKGNS